MDGQLHILGFQKSKKKGNDGNWKTLKDSKENEGVHERLPRWKRNENTVKGWKIKVGRATSEVLQSLVLAPILFLV